MSRAVVFLLGMENVFSSEVWSPPPRFLCGGVAVCGSSGQSLPACGSERPQELKVSLEADILALAPLPRGNLLDHRRRCLFPSVAVIGIYVATLQKILLLLLMIRTMCSVCSAHLVWPPQLQSVFLYPSDGSCFLMEVRDFFECAI